MVVCNGQIHNHIFGTNMQLTKKEQQIIKRFNQTETRLVISRWPQKGTNYDGIATYTQDTVTRIAKLYGTKFVVLAEYKGKGKLRIELINHQVLVIRAFDEYRVHLYPQVLTWLKAFSQVTKVYVHSEFCASGGPLLRFLVIPFLALIRLTGRHITFYAHNVIKSLAGYEPHLGYKENGWETVLLSTGYRWYFRLLALIVQRFVVLEPVVAKRLKLLVGRRPVLVEPHWIAPVKGRLTQKEAKKRLGVASRGTLVVSFGFVTHYKGADFIARWAQWLQQRPEYGKISVALAGGKAYSLKDKPYYKEYYAGIERLAAKLSNLTLTGFLSEAEVKLWLTAADIVVFPYRNLMGGSGALQQALRYGKPVFLSRQMAEGLGVEDEGIVFDHDFKVLANKMDHFNHNERFRNEVLAFSQQYARHLSVERLMPKHFEDVYGSVEINTSRKRIRLLEWGKERVYAIAPVQSE